MKKKLVYQPILSGSKSPRNPKDKCYIIHLKVEYYESQKKEKKADVEMGRQTNVKSARDAFAVAFEPLAKAKKASLLKEEYTGPTMSTAVLIEIDKTQLYDVLDEIRAMDVVEMMEPEIHEWESE